MVKKLKKLLTWLLLPAMLFAGCTVREGGSSQNTVQGNSDPSAEASSVTGVIVDATMNSLLVETPEGLQYAFATENADKTGCSGLLLGSSVTVWFTGVLAVADTGTVVQATRLSQPQGGDTSSASSPQTADIPASLTLDSVLQDNGIFSAYYADALALLDGMTDAQKAGQVLLVRCPQKDAAALIEAYQPGGLVLFGEDFQNRSSQQIIDTLAAYQQAASLPLLLATDEEGGTVVRVSSNPQLAEQRFASPQQLYAAGGLQAVRRDAAAKARLLRSLSLQVNLAPVADVSTNPDDYIYSRTLGQPADITADYVAAVVEATQQEGVATALKHFPGYGDNRDTHTGVAVDQRSLAQFEASDLLPFQAGIDAGAHSVLVSHNVVECFDPAMPASLSQTVHQYLREEMGFTGVILTDDLIMEGVAAYTGGLHPAVQALLAGNDLALLDDLEGGRDAILAALQDGTLPAERLDAAVLRVLAWKYSLGLLPKL